MTKKFLITEIPDYLRLGLGAMVFSVCFLFAVPELNTFIEVTGAVLVAGLVLPAALWLRFRANIPISKTVFVTAIPAGIMGTAVGFQAVTTSTGLPSLGAGASTMSVTVVYGGSLALVAYAFRGNNDHKLPAVNLATLLPCISVITVSISLAVIIDLNRGMTLADYVSLKVFSIYFGVFFLLLVGSASNNVAKILAEASITGIILCIVIALIVWFAGLTVGTIPEDTTNIATLGLLYGSFLFIISYYVSLLTGETDEINFEIKNWHLIESAALYILLVFAPPSIFELAL